MQICLRRISAGCESIEFNTSIKDKSEDSYVMQTLTSAPIVYSAKCPDQIVAISPEEIVVRMLDTTVRA